MFKIGDKVATLGPEPQHSRTLSGKEGEVIFQRNGEVLVRFVGWNEGHDGCSESPSYKHGERCCYWISNPNKNLKIINFKENNMNKITSMAEKFISEDTKALIEAGFLSTNLELTSAGIVERDAIIFDSAQKALIAKAKELIKEKKSTAK